MDVEGTINYKSLSDAYWQKLDRAGERSGDLTRIATLISETCGYGSAIDIGCGEGFLVAELLSQGIDAFGLDISSVVVERANSCWTSRFFEGSALSMPFPDTSFDVVVSTNCLEYLVPADVSVALREMFRVSSQYVFLQISTTHGLGDHSCRSVENRSWWEARCFEAGFRKHALYYRVNPYESLNQDGEQILILLEKVPVDALLNYDLSVLVEERLLHTDMLREVGRRSDAHCIRYHKAAEFIRPGDRVLDVACGLGYGSHILYTASQARSVLGVDLSDFGIAYASAHYGHADNIKFQVGDAQVLDFLPDHSIDFIAAFETIEHVPDPIAYLCELKRVLKPSGRVMVCAPNNWADETGKDPNPHHLHVYTWERLVAECGEFFLLEKGFLQTAGGAMKCHHADRKWIVAPVDQSPEEDAEWVLLMGMADPVAGEGVSYEETAWVLPTAPEFHVSAFARDYLNPWLVKGMVSIGMRAHSMPLLISMQERVLASADPESVDYGAALCGRVYAYVETAGRSVEALKDIESEIWRYAAIPNPSPHQLRWQVSLLFAGGEFARKQGRVGDAISYYTECIGRDVAAYSPLLGNKVVDAFYWLAVLSLSRHEESLARTYLLQSIFKSQQFVSGSWLNVIGKSETPLPFGLAELTQLLDKASRAAYMLAMIDGDRNRGGRLFQESMGFFERQLIDRDHRLNDMSQAVNKLLALVAEKEQTCRRFADEVIRQDAHAQVLAHKVAARDADAQELARQVAEKDMRAQELAQEVMKQDAHAQALARKVVARDADVQELARQVAEKDMRAQELAQEVMKQDAHAQALAREVAARDGDVQQLSGELVLARAEIVRQLEIIKKQDAILAYFRPRLWPEILRRMLRKS
ncbi:ubiquinone/menaquinone biosynthesis C-methylase UbiE [Chitinivorax tropicus]|uniref:Ubiquinone/menaquinone biosynthesis C-methylase UbiE n=1 Tax=Chitinivorax tropicus TaxID=714531 RepID=A0A840MZE7_9PROT|nr:methyltransferase domain-containing protein [Chitinivorax tropicus]MBB5020521.1 ubiquinone/menaquinone biosynthesis C-methylase UbiE [Chitinivorax tropicus]